MKALIAIALGLAGSLVSARAQELTAPLLPVPPVAVPPAFPSMTMDPTTPPAADLADLWKTGTGRDYHYYANVDFNCMWLSGEPHFPAGPLTGGGFSAGVFDNRGTGIGVSGSEFYRSTQQNYGMPPPKP